MKYSRPLIVSVIRDNVHNIRSLRSFEFKGVGFYSRAARKRRPLLTDDIDDLVIDLCSLDDGWEGEIRVAIKGHDLFRHETYLVITLDDPKAAEEWAAGC